MELKIDEKLKNIDSKDIDQESIMKFGQLINSMT
jgi:hypothetical protein